jgi:hypothetical protein
MRAPHSGARIAFPVHALFSNRYLILGEACKVAAWLGAW